MKKLLSLLIVIAVMLGTCIMGIGSAALAVETSPEADFIAFDGVIEDYFGPGGKVVVPSEIDGEPIHEIADYAFANNSDIEEVWICEGIEVIGYRAFYQCPNLYKIELPYSLYEAGSQAFAHCALESITIPGQLEILQYGLCGTNPLSEVIFSYGVKEILTSSFGGGATPYDVVFPASVELICGFSFTFPDGEGSRRFTICNPECEVGPTVQGVKENLNHQWDDVICSLSYSSKDNTQVTTYILPEGAKFDETIEKMQAHLESTKGTDCNVSGNKVKVKYEPQSYFDALPLNQKNAGITAARADLTMTATQAPITPEQPSTPTTPEQPSTPTTPEQPSTPTTPEQPSTPTTPEQPSTPTTPEQPSTPTTPTTPEQPSTPTTPEQPSTPTTPEQPSTPTTPEQPSTPNTQTPNTEAPDVDDPSTQAPDVQTPNAEAPQTPNTQTPNTQTPGTTTTIIEQPGDENLGLILAIAGGVFLLIIIGLVVFLVIFLKKPKAAAPVVVQAAPEVEEAVEETEEVETEEQETQDAE